MRNLQSFHFRHKTSKVAQKELLRLINNFFGPLQISSECYLEEKPCLTVFDFADCKLICVDAVKQLQFLKNRSFRHIEKSWHADCDFQIPHYPMKKGEIQLNLNLDGVPIFKSRKFSIWPFWLQVVNLPPKLRSSFKNNLLLGLWQGISKPDWETILPKISFEMESLEKPSFNEHIGTFKCKFCLLICDMPAKAAALNMNQFNGFNGCTHCLMIGKREDHRTLYPCTDNAPLRDEKSFSQNAKKAEETKKVVAGIKGQSFLKSHFAFPWDAPVDPMHQIYLGTGKSLTKRFVSSLKKFELSTLNTFLQILRIPNEFLRRPKKVEEISYWKAGDFKLMFLHIIPLIIGQFKSLADKKKKKYQKLSLAVRLLSLKQVREEHVKEASSLIQSFFSNFTEIYGTNMQSYNFQSMRHLCDQVRRVGPLWNTSAFSYESANHFLVKNVAGTVKSPEAIVEAFLKSKEVFICDDTEPDFETLKKFSKVSTDCHNFCKIFPGPQDFFGRFRTPDGVILSSLSYSRLNDNVSNCVIQTRSGIFVQVECYLSIESTLFAIVRTFRNVKTFDELPRSLRTNFLYRLEDLGPLERINTDQLAYKCVLIELQSGTFLASVVKEGFEHN